MDGARVATHLDVECAADAFTAPLNVDLYLLQRHELSMEPERTIAALRTILSDGLRGGQCRCFGGTRILLRNAWVRKGNDFGLVTYCCEAANSGSPPVFV